MTKRKLCTTSSLIPMWQCPCGVDQCYVDGEVLEEEESAEFARNAEPSFPSGTTQNFDATKVIPPPYVGQSFQTDDEALEYYSNFAQNNGFFVRRERSKGNREHPLGVYKRELVCHRAGPPLPVKSEDTKRHKKKKSSRCRCKAQMIIKKNITAGVSRWLVVNFSNVHNHEMLDKNNAQYSSGYHCISAVDRELISSLAKGGCNTSLILQAIETEKGVKPGALTFTEKDINNFLQASTSINLENEGPDLLKSCKVMKEKNPDFRYEFTSNETNKLEHIAWSYVSSVRAYKVFGDVVFFDTTFRLNAYDRPMGAWFGVDNNGHTILFGGVILLDDKPDSYKWALQAFLRFMDGKFPQTIVTDFHLGLKEAILIELPHTKHAISLWHLMPKLECWFYSLLGSRLERFKSEFCKLHDLESKEEFDQQWNQIVIEFGLSSDRHMALLFIYRSYWAVPYLRNWFFGGLLVTGHSLSIKFFLKGFVNSQTRLKDFIEQVGVATDFQNQAAEEATRHHGKQSVHAKTCLPIEEHASKVLSHFAFEMFQNEIMLSTQYAVFEASEDRYLVRHYLSSDGGGYTVNYTTSNEEINCECQGFQFSGMLCRHALRVLSLKNCFLIPEKHLLPRWRRDSSLFSKSCGQNSRCQALRSLASIIVQESSIAQDRFDYVHWHMSRLLNHVREMPPADETTLDLETNSSCDATVDIVPARGVTRGRPKKNKRDHYYGKGHADTQTLD